MRNLNDSFGFLEGDFFICLLRVPNKVRVLRIVSNRVMQYHVPAGVPNPGTLIEEAMN